MFNPDTAAVSAAFEVDQHVALSFLDEPDLAIAPMGPKFVVTLVHGTFATDAPWMKPDSPLRKRLQARFGDDIHFEPFNWYPADNSIDARWVAAGRLSSHLEQVKHDYPDAAQYIIAHSHGGNIALDGANQYMSEHAWPNIRGTFDAYETYKQLDKVACDGASFIATRDDPGVCPGENWQLLFREGLNPAVAERKENLVRAGVHKLWGVACLSTPFIHASVRDLRGLTNKNLWKYFFILFLLCGIWLESSRFLYWMIVSVILAYAMVVVRDVIGRLFAGELERIPLIATALRTRVPAVINLLIIRGAGDEALLALDTAGLFSRYLSKTFNWLTEHQVNPEWRSSKVLAWLHVHGWMRDDQAERWPSSRNVSLPKIVWACWAALFATLLVIAFQNGLSEIANLRLPAGFLTAAEILFFGTLAIKTTMLDWVLYPVALIVLGSISVLGTYSWGTVPNSEASSGRGWILGLAVGLLVEVTAEALPFGDWSAIQLGLDITGAQEKLGLRHSVYEDHRTHDELETWLARSEERRLDSLRETSDAQPE
jgi:hypothetical protein